MANDSTISCLERQVDCYRQLAKLTELQHVHVQQNQTDSLLEVLRRRREVLDEIGRIEHEIAPVKRTWMDYVGAAAPEERTRAESLLAEARTLLEQITTADRNDTLVLQQRKLNLGRQIQQAKAAKEINRSYGAAAYGGSAGTAPSRMDVQK